MGSARLAASGILAAFRVALRRSTRRRDSHLRVSATAICLAIAASISAQSGASRLNSDEDVMFFPGIAFESGPGTWTADVRGWIFERGRAAQGIAASRKDRSGPIRARARPSCAPRYFASERRCSWWTTSATSGWRSRWVDPPSRSRLPRPAAMCATGSC